MTIEIIEWHFLEVKDSPQYENDRYSNNRREYEVEYVSIEAGKVGNRQCEDVVHSSETPVYWNYQNDNLACV